MTATAVISISVPTANVRILVTDYPLGSGVTPTNAVIPFGTPSLSGVPLQPLTTYGPGEYKYTLTNTVTNCQKTGVFCSGWCPYVIQFSGAAPTCSACCNGSIFINPNGSTNYTVSSSSGSLNGNPATIISNLCYGVYTICITNTIIPDQFCTTYTVDGTTNVQTQKQNDLTLGLFPNPSDDLLNLIFYEAGDYTKFSEAELLNNVGELVKEIKLNFENKKEIVGIGDLPPGVYLLRIKGENSQAVTKRFIITR